MANFVQQFKGTLPLMSVSYRENPRLLLWKESFGRINDTDAREMLRKVDGRFRRLETKLFKTEGASGGSPWKPLSPDYAKWKRKHSSVQSILQLKARSRAKRHKSLRKRWNLNVKKSLTRQHDQHHVRFYTWRAQGTRVVFSVGTSLRRALYHMPKSIGGKRNPFYNPRIPDRDPMQYTLKQIRGYGPPLRAVLVRKMKQEMRALAAAGSALKGRR